MSDESTAQGALGTANTVLHEGIDDALLDVLEAITALDSTASRNAWERFVALLDAHTRLEEREIFPRYATLDDHPRGGGPDLFEADHVSLRKVMATAAEAVDAIAAAGPNGRREMVTRLGPLLRVRNVLEHHTLREDRFLYPRLDASLPAAEAEALSRRVLASGPSGRSSG